MENRMKTWMRTLSYVAVAAILSACGGQKGAEFVGSWQAKEHANRQAVVERNGDNFVIKVTEPAMYPRGKVETTAVPAAYKDGMLEVAAGSGTFKLAYVKATDTMLMPTMGGSMEYRRVK
jgi:hypothetical protein